MSAGFGVHTGPDFTKYAKFGYPNSDSMQDFIITNYADTKAIYFKNGKMTSDELEVSGFTKILGTTHLGDYQNVGGNIIYVYGSLRGALSGSTNTLELAGIVNNVGDPAGNARLLTKQVAFESHSDNDRGIFWFKEGTASTTWTRFDMDSAGESTSYVNSDPYSAITADGGTLKMHARGSIRAIIDYNDEADSATENAYFSVVAKRPEDVNQYSKYRFVTKITEYGEIATGWNPASNNNSALSEDLVLFTGPQRDTNNVGTTNKNNAGFCQYDFRNKPTSMH